MAISPSRADRCRKACRLCRPVSLVHGSAVALARAVAAPLPWPVARGTGGSALIGLAASLLRNLTLPTQGDLLPGWRGRLCIEPASPRGERVPPGAVF